MSSRGSPTLGELSSTPTAGPGETKPRSRCHGLLGLSGAGRGCLGQAGAAQGGVVPEVGASRGAAWPLQGPHPVWQEGHGPATHTCCLHSTCSRGRWACQQGTHCPSTCTLYGEGHIVTFDGQRFVFDGNCEYILATVSTGRGAAGPRDPEARPPGLLLSALSLQDGCGANDSQPTFKILTENVICGNSGVTCSRAIKIFLGVSSEADWQGGRGGRGPLPHSWTLPTGASRSCPEVQLSPPASP